MPSPHEEALAETAIALLRPLIYLWSELRALTPQICTILFFLIVILRYTRINNPNRIWRSYRPMRLRCRNKRYTERDVTVILPTTNPDSDSFTESIVTILESRPYAVLVVTVQGPVAVQTQRILEAYRHSYPKTRIGLAATRDTSERVRIAHAVRQVVTHITVLADDSVSWTRATLPWLLAPFQDDDKVAIVNIEKRLRRIGEREWSLSSAMNFLACLCFTKRAHDLREASCGRNGTYTLVTSFLPSPFGRTTAYRTAFLDDEAILARLRNTEKPLSGIWGRYHGKSKRRPAEEADDIDIETFLAREAVARRGGAKLVFQSAFCPGRDDPVVEVTPPIATSASLRHLFLLDARRTVRNILATLCNLRLLFRRPKSYFLSLFTALRKVPLVWDWALLWTFSHGTLCRYVDGRSGMMHWSQHKFLMLCALIVLVKYFRFSSHFARYPYDLVYIPYHVVGGLVHLAIKVWALLTCRVDASRRQASDKLNGPADGFVGDINSWNFRAVL